MKTIPKTVSLFLTILTLALCLTACGGLGGILDTHKGLSMNDINWTVDGEILGGERYLLLSLENNSQYIIADFEITFIEKRDLSAEQRSAFFDDLVTTFGIDLSDPDDAADLEKMKLVDISMRAEVKQLLHTGEKCANRHCYYYTGSVYVKNAEHYDLVAPDIATIRYVDEGQLITMYYDFSSRKYTTEEETAPVVNWSTFESTSVIPKPDAEVIIVETDSDDRFTCEVCGVTEEQFKAYVKQCRTAGFTQSVFTHTGYFSAKTRTGKDLTLDYDADEQRIRISSWDF